ncbi:DNA-binding protein [Marinobacter sp. SS5-14b]|jgi:hypothetical protein|uniref:DNA-binding protein n=1 Tax=Marinobacter sp. SS5-14b TaxID=3050456 RepID=UPI000C3EE0F5|nr:DNA-binding protein [Marinobacter sp. SS5-14b]MBQ91876.1 DNA-binding protein [Marinobacter sp.]|tara:strand:- start:604 stop:834 length:231 start_codon:yes stop_codon:yes gene_type:complete
MNSTSDSTQTKSLPALVPGRWVRPNLLPVLFGINAEQARKYRERGFWLEEKHWRFDPVRRVVYNPEEIANWFEGKL